MLNNVMLVGRLANDIEKKTLESGKEVLRVSLAVNRSYKNPEGIYETDFIDCILWENTAKATSEYCHQGDIVGIKGRIQSRVYEKDKEKKYVVEIIAEKVTFLTSKKEETE